MAAKKPAPKPARRPRGRPPVEKQATPEMWAEAAQHLAISRNMLQTANHFGIDRSTLRQWLNKHYVLENCDKSLLSSLNLDTLQRLLSAMTIIALSNSYPVGDRTRAATACERLISRINAMTDIEKPQATQTTVIVQPLMRGNQAIIDVIEAAPVRELQD